MLAKVIRLISNLFRRDRLEETLDEELRGYLDEMTERKVREGLSRAEARRQALLEAGGMEQVKEEVRGAWLGSGIESTLRDVRFAGRALLRSPGFTLVVILTLAMGIGTNLTIFSVMRAVLWRPLPYPSAERLVTVQVDAHNVANAGAAPGEVFDLKSRSKSLEDVSTISAVDANLDYGGEMEHVAAASVSDDFLPLLGGRPTVGRSLEARIDEREQVRNVLISDELWRRRFGADANVVGRAVRINNLEMQIVGVLPAGFRLYLPPSTNAQEVIDIWFPTGIGTTREHRGYPIVARLKEGVTQAQANAELQTIAAQFVRDHADNYSDGKLRITTHVLHEEMTREARPALFLLACAVGFVLLIACVNAANLMLARGAGRQREFAIRRALGAGNGRLIRQQLTESLVLALVSAVAGLVLARAGLDAISQLGNIHLPLQSRVAMDGAVAGFALVLSLVTSLLFGLMPAWRLSSGKLGDPLKAGRADTASSGMRRLQRGLVIVEVALSIVPLTCGGLMLRSFVKLVEAPLGFDPAHVLTAKVPISFRKYPQVEQRVLLHRDILERVRALPGVEGVSAAAPLPLAAEQITRRVGRTDRPGVPAILATQQVAMEDYLKLVGTPLLAGRAFTADDLSSKRPVAIVDDRLARRLWPEGAIGRRLRMERGATQQELEVIGVTAAVRSTRVRDEDMPHFVIPYSLYPIEMSLVVKTRESGGALGPAIQSAVQAAQTARAAFDFRPMDDYVRDSIGDTRFMMWLLAAFAAASVLLAAVGLYGTLAYLIAQRTREFGIRLALGSTARGILAMVVREGALLAGAGVVLGLAGSSAITGVIRQFLYNVSPFDNLTLTGVVVLTAAVAMASGALPAWRAAQIEPTISLRSE